MTSAATLTSKGQTTIPKEIRDALGMKAGDRMTFTAMPDGTVIIRLKNRNLLEQAGSLARAGRKPVSLDRMTPWK